MYTGSESPVQKERNKQAFINRESQLLIISLRSGAGVDGWQDVCSVVVHGELDWSPQVMKQLTGRVNRERTDGQANQVNEFFIVTADGSDPTIMKVLGLKASQATAIQDPTLHFEQVYSDDSRIKLLAQQFLENRKKSVN